MSSPALTEQLYNRYLPPQVTYRVAVDPFVAETFIMHCSAKLRA